MSDDILIANIDIAALAVGQGDVDEHALGLPAMADFSRPYISQTVLGGSSPFAEGKPLKFGIHLHWSLPRQLTRGGSKTQGLRFPAVPDRWLVTRILQQDSNTMQLKSWVVESDRLSDTGNPETPTILFKNKKRQPQMAWIGQVFDAETWQETLDRSEERSVGKGSTQRPGRKPLTPMGSSARHDHSPRSAMAIRPLPPSTPIAFRYSVSTTTWLASGAR